MVYVCLSLNSVQYSGSINKSDVSLALLLATVLSD